MRKWWVLAAGAMGAATATFAPRAQAQEPGLVAGRVEAEGSAVPYARVEVRGAAAGAVADSAGEFRLRLAAGRYVLLATALGYASSSVPVEVAAGAVTEVRVELRSSALSLNPIVVTGTRKETFVTESPVKVEVVSGSYLRRKPSSNLMDVVGQVNGLYTQIDCGVCYTNNIRINGMEGPYTAVLIDGMPIMSALGAVYGLNGLNPSLVERLEVVKGPASTLYGPEAMAGVVNVITKDTRFAPRLVVEGRTTSVGRSTLEASGAVTSDQLGAFLSGSAVHMDRFVDGNGDGFSDTPLETRLSLFGRLDWLPAGRKRLSVSGKLYDEERFGGVESWTSSDRGSSTVYGEWIRTRRLELLGTWTPAGPVRAEAAVTEHRQDSWYGDQRFEAGQRVLYGAVLLDARPSQRHDVLVGLAARYTRYDDDTPATTSAERTLVPGLFVQDEVSVGPNVTVLGGLRLDHHRDHGAILSPRLSAKWQAGEETAVRVNTGTGFRVVHVFTEDHAALTGAREVVIEESLDPERSISVAGNLNHTLDLLGGEAMVDLDVFYTRFSNRIIPDYDTDPNRIYYRNLDGRAVSRGVSLAWNHIFLEPALSYDAGLTVQDVYVVESGARRAQLFSPRFTGVLSASWRPAPRLSLDYTARFTGPMSLPEYAEPHTRPSRSPTYSVHDVQVAVDVSGGLEAYGAARNLFDFRQGSPLIAPADPFGDAFDTAYVWGPILGRELVLGLRLGVSR